MKNLIYKYHEKWACKSTFSIVLNSLFPDFLPPFCRPGFRLYDTGAVRTVRLKRYPRVAREKRFAGKKFCGKKSQEIVEKKGASVAWVGK